MITLIELLLYLLSVLRKKLGETLMSILSICFIAAHIPGFISSYNNLQNPGVANYHEITAKAFEVQELANIFNKIENISTEKQIAKYQTYLRTLSNNLVDRDIIKNNSYDFEFKIPIINWDGSDILMNKKIYFINSRNFDHIGWLYEEIKNNKENVLVVSLYGVYGDHSISSLSGLLQKNIYFDDTGEVAKRFNIIGLPAIIEQRGSFIIVKEQKVR